MRILAERGAHWWSELRTVCSNSHRTHPLYLTAAYIQDSRTKYQSWLRMVAAHRNSLSMTGDGANRRLEPKWLRMMMMMTMITMN